jgi:poly(3-hydroxybutyrate) depolymerase
MVTVGPLAPWNRESYHRWCLRCADEYLADVILECKSRFSIDPDRVFLLGHSTGGFGTYHHALRQPDRFAAVVVSSGSWSLGYWPVIRGTPLCTVQGVHDARPGVRWRYTDVEYGRWTDKILSRENLDHVYLEHGRNHGIGYGREKIAQFFASARDLRRDPIHENEGRRVGPGQAGSGDAGALAQHGQKVGSVGQDPRVPTPDQHLPALQKV